MKSSVESRIIERLEDFAQAVEGPEPITARFKCRRRVRPLRPKIYDARTVKGVRQSLGANQAAFAIFLGIPLRTVQAWERGTTSPNRMACRFLEEIQRAPALHRKHLKQMLALK